eukprot:GEMP01032586.1.p1 GENE.GEMP01032586.1~~GEMP01032586.1.p1  ORF type:complete len:570 (+),score=142.12 GEMP01032586.1:86-1795(+)
MSHKKNSTVRSSQRQGRHERSEHRVHFECTSKPHIATSPSKPTPPRLTLARNGPSPPQRYPMIATHAASAPPCPIAAWPSLADTQPSSCRACYWNLPPSFHPSCQNPPPVFLRTTQHQPPPVPRMTPNAPTSASPTALVRSALVAYPRATMPAFLSYRPPVPLHHTMTPPPQRHATPPPSFSYYRPLYSYSGAPTICRATTPSPHARSFLHCTPPPHSARAPSPLPIHPHITYPYSPLPRTTMNIQPAHRPLSPPLLLRQSPSTPHLHVPCAQPINVRSVPRHPPTAMTRRSAPALPTSPRSRPTSPMRSPSPAIPSERPLSSHLVQHCLGSARRPNRMSPPSSAASMPQAPIPRVPAHNTPRLQPLNNYVKQLCARGMVGHTSMVPGARTPLRYPLAAQTGRGGMNSTVAQQPEWRQQQQRQHQPKQQQQPQPKRQHTQQQQRQLQRQQRQQQLQRRQKEAQEKQQQQQQEEQEKQQQQRHEKQLQQQWQDVEQKCASMEIGFTRSTIVRMKGTKMDAMSPNSGDTTLTHGDARIFCFGYEALKALRKQTEDQEDERLHKAAAMRCHV